MNYFKGRLILVVLFCLLNPVIYGRPDVSSINQGKNTDEFVFLLPGKDGNSNLYSRTSLENSEYNSGLLAPSVPDKLDSYGKPIPDPKKVVNAGGLRFEIPTYASGISGIRESNDDLLPPIGSNENPSSHVHQPSVDLLPPLPLGQDESLNEISYTTSTSVPPSTKFPNTSPVDKTLSSTVPTNVPFVKYTGGFGGAPGILGEQTEIGTFFKSMQDKTSEKNNEYSTTTSTSTSTTQSTPTTPTTEATYNDNKHFLPTPITELIAPPLPPSNQINDKPEQTPTSFPVRSNFDLNQSPTVPFQQDFTSQSAFSTSTIEPQQNHPPTQNFPTSTFGSPQQNNPPAHNFPTSQFGSPQQNTPPKNNFPTSTFGSPQQNTPPKNNFPTSTFGSPQQNTPPAHNFPTSQFGSPQQNTPPNNNFPTSQFGSPQQNTPPAHNFPTSQFGSPQQNTPPKNNFPTSTFGSPQQNTPPKNNFPTSTFGSPQQNTPPAHNFPTSQFGSPQQNTPPNNNFPTSQFGSPQQNTPPAHNFPTSQFGSPQQNTPPKNNFPTSTFGSPQQNTPPAHNFPTSTFGSPQQNTPPAHNFPTSTFGSPQQNIPSTQNFDTFTSPTQHSPHIPSAPGQSSSVGKYSGGFGGAPGVLGDQKKPGFAIQPDGSIKDPDHTYRPPTHANPITPTVPPQIPAQPAHSTTPIKYAKYTGGFGGPSGVLSPA